MLSGQKLYVLDINVQASGAAFACSGFDCGDNTPRLSAARNRDQVPSFDVLGHPEWNSIADSGRSRGKGLLRAQQDRRCIGGVLSRKARWRPGRSAAPPQFLAPRRLHLPDKSQEPKRGSASSLSSPSLSIGTASP